jgi:multicomponent Na+:H+ antiporter subunit C
MNVVLSVAVGALFGSGAYLILKPDLFRVVVGMVLISNAAILALMSSGLTRGQAPITPVEKGEKVADPLVQAMTLTAVVIGLAVTALLLGLAYRVYATHRTVDLDELARSEVREDEESKREEVSV